MSTTPSIPPTETRADRVGVLFVCLGNICRSPLAKWVFMDAAEHAGLTPQLDIDSCGTGHWHAGGPADPRSTAIAQRFGLATPHVARQVAPLYDFERFRLLIAMDRANVRRLLELGAPRDRVRLMRSFDPALASAPDHAREVPDPYEGTERDFEEVYWMIQRASSGLIEHVRQLIPSGQRF